MTPRRKRVALLVETSLGSGREILRGIARFSRQSEDWELFHAARGLEDSFPDWLEDWDGMGVIARIQNRSMARRLETLKIPVVDVLGVCENDFPLVHVDDAQISATVSEHFRERDFRHVGFYGIEGENWSERRCAAFREHWRDGESFSLLEIPRDEAGGSAESFEKLKQWLRNLTKPVAVMVSSDQLGLALLEACRTEEIDVPEQIAVASVDNDLALCEISTPPLSSVRGGHFRVGFEAAALLDQLIGGKAAPQDPILVPPTGIVLRESSNIHAIDDSSVARGIRYVRDHLAERLTNEQIAKAVGVSRTVFQKRFLKATSQTIREFILQQRIQKASTLIRGSELPFAEVAYRAGFRHQEYLGHVLKSRLGLTPGEMRRQKNGS